MQPELQRNGSRIFLFGRRLGKLLRHGAVERQPGFLRQQFPAMLQRLYLRKRRVPKRRGRGVRQRHMRCDGMHDGEW